MPLSCRHRRRSLSCLEALEPRLALTGRIQGHVWNDWNRDGRRDSPDIEYRVADVRVALIDADGTMVTETVTDREGVFDFSGLYPGDYSLEFIPPEGTIFTKPFQGGTKKDSNVIPSSGRTTPIKLSADEVIETIDAGILAPFGSQSITGQVWEDSNANGLRDPSEKPLSKVAVKLENRLGRKLYEVETNELGVYSFPGNTLLPGQFVADFRKPSPAAGVIDWQFSPEGKGIGVNSHANVNDGKTSTFSVEPRESLIQDLSPVTRNAGFFPGAELTSQVWHDANHNGLYDDATEYGVSDLPVELLDESGQVIDQSRTDGGGSVRFIAKPGTYRMRYEPPLGVNLTQRTASDGTQHASSADPQTRLSDPMVVSEGTKAIHHKVGVHSPEGAANVSGSVWHDLNANGVQDAGEFLMGNMLVSLQNSSHIKVAVTTTDASGHYFFNGADLLQGQYYVTLERGHETGPPSFQFSPRDRGENVNENRDSDFEPFTGKTPLLVIPSKTSGFDRRTLSKDAGIFFRATVQGSLWDDEQPNGKRDPGERPLPDYEVQLLDAHGSIIAATRTSPKGTYKFQDIRPAEGLVVRVSEVDGVESSVVNPVAPVGNHIIPGTRSTLPFTIRSGDQITRNGALHGKHGVTGVFGTIWNDVNGNGIQDPDESSRPNTKVSLLTSENSSQPRSMMTDEDGKYYFFDLPDGFYKLSIELPEQFSLSPIKRGGDDATDSDFLRSTLSTPAFFLQRFQVRQQLDAGVFEVKELGNVADSLRLTEIALIGHGQPEFLELKNTGTRPISLDGVRFTDGVDFDFSTGAIRILFPGEHVVVAGKSAVFNDRDRMGSIAGVYQGDLGRSERLTLVDRDNKTLLNFRYDDDWFILMNNEYEPWTLTVMDETASGDTYFRKQNWRPSSFKGGSPGADDPHIMPKPGSVVISEVMTNSGDGFNDLIELHNTTTDPINIGNWYLGDYTADDINSNEGVYHLTRYRIAPETILPPNGYISFSRQSHFENPSDPGAISNFGLSSFGEQLHLLAADAYGTLLGYSDSVTFSGSDVDVSYARYQLPDGETTMLVSKTPTIGGPNSPPQIGPIVIDQIMYRPSNGIEYLRLVNASDDSVPLYTRDEATGETANIWRVDGAITFSFAEKEPAKLAPGQHALLVPIDPNDFRALYGVPEEIAIYGPYAGELNNSGETISVHRPSVIRRQTDPIERSVLADRVHYSSLGPWPVEAYAIGAALVRKSPEEIGDNPLNWTTSFARTDSYLSQGYFLRQAYRTESAKYYGRDVLGVASIKTIDGDVNGDGRFNSSDLVLLFQAGKYLEEVWAEWSEGDWNGDSRFDQKDLIAALQKGFE